MSPDFIDHSVYPDLDELPEALETAAARADYVPESAPDPLFLLMHRCPTPLNRRTWSTAMAGTLEVSDQLCWMPAGWVYDSTLERIASFLEQDDPPLADLLLNSRTDENGGHCDIRMCDGPRLLRLIQAADDAYRKAEGEGANSFYDPSSYHGFMDQFQGLREILRTRQKELS